MSLPELPYGAWRPTRDTLHLWVQVVGKVKLAATPPRNHWWNAALHLDPYGLTTRRLHRDGVSFSIDFDFTRHRLRVRTSRGEEDGFELHDGLAVAEFHAQLHGVLERLGVGVETVDVPFATPVSDIPFHQDRTHASYDPEWVARFWRVLDWSDWVLERFAGWYCGKTSPVNVFWHSFDLAVTRFSGRRADVPAGADPVTREAYSHELISFGFWPGDANVPEASFYSYTAPEPDGLRSMPLAPAEAGWQEGPAGSMARVSYEAVRSSPDPERALLAFLQSAYEAGARGAEWEQEELASSWCPAAGELRELTRTGAA